MRHIIIAILTLLASLCIVYGANAQGKYYIFSTEQVTVKDDLGQDVTKDVSRITEASLPDMVRDDPTDALKRIETYIEAQGLDDDGKPMTYAKRVNALEWNALGRPKRLTPWYPDRVLLGHDPVMPKDAEIEAALDKVGK